MGEAKVEVSFRTTSKMPLYQGSAEIDGEYGTLVLRRNGKYWLPLNKAIQVCADFPNNFTCGDSRVVQSKANVNAGANPFSGKPVCPIVLPQE